MLYLIRQPYEQIVFSVSGVTLTMQATNGVVGQTVTETFETTKEAADKMQDLFFRAALVGFVRVETA